VGWLSAALLYAGWALVPSGLFVLASLGAVAFDEWLGFALVSELDARGAVIVLVSLLLLALSDKARLMREETNACAWCMAYDTSRARINLTTKAVQPSMTAYWLR